MFGYSMPEGMVPANLDERREFYQKEFDLAKAKNWITDRKGRTKFAVIIGRHTKIYPEKYKRDSSTTIIIDEYSNFGDVLDEIEEFLPESVYYDRNIYDENGKMIGQELAFDLDPENVTCPVHGSLADKMKKGQGLSFCNIELNIVKKKTFELYDCLERQYSELAVVYSGRGFHLHVFDEAAYNLTRKERNQIAQDIKEKGFQIDDWVTTGEMRLIRLPYSLNGLVSRIVVPLQKKEILEFDPIRDKRCVPNFLKHKLTS
jgi:DNA primase catalytic subunit